MPDIEGKELEMFMTEVTTGLSRRDYFAAMAMVGVLSGCTTTYKTTETTALVAMDYADALIAALDEDKKETDDETL